MPKLPIVSGVYVMQMLERYGFKCSNTQGSHYKYVKVIENTKYITTVPKHKELDPLTLKSILRQSNIMTEIFMKYWEEH